MEFQDTFCESDDESAMEPDISQDWSATPCMKLPLKKLNEFIRSLSSSEEVQPVTRQLGMSWSEASPATQRYYRGKSQQVVNLVLHCLAPGQATVLLNELMKTEYNRNNDDEQGKVSHLITLFKEANSWFLKRQILSVFVRDYSKRRLQELIPGLSVWAIDEARKHAARTGAGKPAPRLQPIKRARLDPAKVDHFIAFISSPNFLQDVAYGTRTLKLSSGDRLEIPNAVRTVIASKIIQLYQRYCKETNFNSLGRTTLFSILEVCNTEMREN